MTEKSDILNSYVIPEYEMLHTQSKEYIVDDIINLIEEMDILIIDFIFMVLYLEVQTPDLVHSRENLDFGRGFYTTPLYEQAIKWCERFKRRGKRGIVSHYSFDESAYQRLKILKCRRGMMQPITI